MSKTVWGIELGTHSIKAVKIASGKEGLEIVDLDVVDLPAEDPDMPQPREERLQSALETLRDSKDIKKQDTIYISIPGHQTLNKLITVTPPDAGKLAETIHHEAKQQLPINLEDTIWDYQVIDKKFEAGQEIQVSLFVVKKEIVQSYLKLMDEAALSVSGIQVAPLAIYNFIKFDQKFPRSGIVVDIGADNTDVVIVDENKTWIRNVPDGGNNITRALAERFKIPPDEAEQLKLKAAKSKQAQKIFGVMKPTLRELLSEITRSVGFYKSQHPKVKLNYMLLMGAGSHLLGLKKFFEQQLQHRVDKLTHLKRLKLGRSANPEVLQANIASLGVALGLAIQAAGMAENRVNLVPQELKISALVSQRYKFVLAAAVLMAVAAIFPMFGAGDHQAAAAATQQLGSVRTEANAQRDRFRAIEPIQPVEAELTRYTRVFDGYGLSRIAEDSLRGVMNNFGALERTLAEHNAKATFDLSGLAGFTGTLTRSQFRNTLRASTIQALRLDFDELDINGDDQLTGDELRNIRNRHPRTRPLFVRLRPVQGSTVEQRFFDTLGISSGQVTGGRAMSARFPTGLVDERGNDITMPRFYRSRSAALQLELAIPIDYTESTELGTTLVNVASILRREVQRQLDQRTGHDPRIRHIVEVITSRATQDGDAQSISELTGAESQQRGGGRRLHEYNLYRTIQVVVGLQLADGRVGTNVDVTRERNITALFRNDVVESFRALSPAELEQRVFVMGNVQMEQVGSTVSLKLLLSEETGQPVVRAAENGYSRVTFRYAEEGTTRRSAPDVTTRVFAP